MGKQLNKVAENLIPIHFKLSLNFLDRDPDRNLYTLRLQAHTAQLR